MWEYLATAALAVNHIVCPPDTSMRWPLTQRLSGPSKLATMGPMSSGRPTRPSAVMPANAWL